MELTWEEMEMVRHESGRAMFRSELRRRDARGELEIRPVRVWIPGSEDYVVARQSARITFAEKKELDPKLDKDIFDAIEQRHLLARAIRTADGQHSQEMDYEELGTWDEKSLADIQEKINVVREMMDPRDTVLEDDDKFWMMILRVAKRGNLGPLADIVGHEQSSFIVRMARQACGSPHAPSSVQSFASSMLGLSPSQSSDES